MADQVLYSGVACITDLMVKEGLINLDFADVRSIMSEMGKAMMGTGEATGERRAVMAAEAAIANPLLDETSMKGARGLLISITGGNDLTLYEVDEAASRIRQEVDEEANIILGATFDSALDGVVRVSVVATGIDQATIEQIEPVGSPPRAEARRSRAASSAPRPLPAADRARKSRRRAGAGSRRGGRADEQSRSRSAAPRPSRRCMPSLPAPAHEEEPIEQRVHSAGAGTADVRAAAHAADRGTAAGRAEPAARAPRRSAAALRRRSRRAAGRCWRSSPPSASAATRTPRRRPARPRSARRRRGRAAAAACTPNTAVRSPVRPRRVRRRASSIRMAAPAPRAAPLEDDQLEIPAFLRRQSN